jgi:hypothetical protein
MLHRPVKVCFVNGFVLVRDFGCIGCVEGKRVRELW